MSGRPDFDDGYPMANESLDGIRHSAELTYAQNRETVALLAAAASLPRDTDARRIAERADWFIYWLKMRDLR